MSLKHHCLSLGVQSRLFLILQSGVYAAPERVVFTAPERIVSASLSGDIATAVENGLAMKPEDVVGINGTSNTILTNRVLSNIKKHTFSISGITKDISVFNCKLVSGNELNISYNKEISFLGDADKRILDTTVAGQQLLSTLSENGTIENALSVSLTDKKGNKMLAGIATGGTLFSPGKDGSLFVTTTRTFSSGQKLAGIVNCTEEDRSAVVVYKLNKVGVDYERVLSTGVNNGKFGAIAGFEHKKDTRTLNAGLGILENQLGLKTRWEKDVDPNTRVNVSTVVEKTVSVGAKVIFDVGRGALEFSCLLDQRQGQAGFNYTLEQSDSKLKELNVSARTIVERNKKPDLGFALEGRCRF